MADYFEGFNAEYRLVDVDGIVLASPLDYIVINEPEDFDKVKIKLKRSKNHGIDFEFSDPETPYKFDQVVHDDEKGVSDHSAYSFIQAMYDAAGVDANCMFQVLHIGENPEIQYQGRLSMKFGINDDKNQMTARRVNLDDLFRTRLETKVDFTKSVSIDGVSINPLFTNNMVLHSKLIEEKLYATSSNSLHTAFLSTAQRRHVQFDMLTDTGTTSYNRELEDKYGTGLTTQLVETNVEDLEHNYAFRNVEGNLNITMRIHYFMSITNFGGVSGITRLGTFIRINDVETLIDSGITYPPEVGSTFQGEVNLFYQGNFYIPKGSRVFMYDKWDIPGINLGLTQLHSIAIQPNHNFAYSFDSITPNTIAPTYNLFDSLKHILAITNNANDLLVSSFLQSEAADFSILNGYMLRGYSVSNKPLKMSFKDIFDGFIMPSFGLGFAIVDVGGISKVLMERYDFFYADKEIITIDSIEEGSWNLIYDKDVFFNEIELGYKHFPKSTDENKGSNLDEYHTKQELILPLETIKKKSKFISDVIAGGTLIESQRREQFNSKPNETVSYDENVFVIKGINSDSYNPTTCSFAVSTDGNGNPIYFIDLKGKFYQVLIGDVLTFTNTVSNNSTFTVIDISQEITGNVDFDFGLRLTVAEVVVPESVTVAIMTIPSVIYRSERNEAFDTLDGVHDADTEYNAGLNPKNMLMNQSLIINSGMNKKAGTAVIKTQEAFLNGLMRSQFKVGEGSYVLDPDRQVIIQNEDLTLSQINQNKKLHTGMKFTFSCRLDYSIVLKIRDASLNQSMLDINYGWIKVLGDDGIYHKGHILDMDYIPLSNWASFVCREFFE